jgi:hypothetical protein
VNPAASTVASKGEHTWKMSGLARVRRRKNLGALSHANGAQAN